MAEDKFYLLMRFYVFIIGWALYEGVLSKYNTWSLSNRNKNLCEELIHGNSLVVITVPGLP